MTHKLVGPIFPDQRRQPAFVGRFQKPQRFKAWRGDVAEKKRVAARVGREVIREPPAAAGGSPAEDRAASLEFFHGFIERGVNGVEPGPQRGETHGRANLRVSRLDIWAIGRANLRASRN